MTRRKPTRRPRTKKVAAPPRQSRTAGKARTTKGRTKIVAVPRRAAPRMLTVDIARMIEAARRAVVKTARAVMTARP